MYQSINNLEPGITSLMFESLVSLGGVKHLVPVLPFRVDFESFLLLILAARL
jgi:hypothetical protein